MIWIDIIFIIIIAAIISGILGLGFGWRHPSRPEAVGVSTLFLFLLLVFAMWAGSGWFPAMGPVLFGIHWVFPLVVGLLVALIVLAVSAPPRKEPGPSVKTIQEEEDEIVATTVFGIFFWILIIGLLATGVASYYI